MKLVKRYGLLNLILLIAVSTGRAQSVDNLPMNALVFNGTSTYGYIHNSGAIETRAHSAFTVEGWFKTDHPSQTMTITAKTDFSEQQDYHFLIGLDNGVLRFIRGDKELLGQTEVEAGVWNHFSATYLNNFMYLYLNGRLESMVHGPLPLPEGYDLVEVGATPTSTGRTNFWNGTLEELKYWGEGKSAGEVLLGVHRVSLVNEGIPKTYYQFNGFSGPQSDQISDAFGDKILMVQDGTLIQSTCPVGASNGVWMNQFLAEQEFEGTDVVMQFGSNMNVPVAVNAMADLPGSWAGIENEHQILDNRYWIVDWIEGQSNPTIGFQAQSALPDVLQLLPSSAILYRRDLNASNNWTLVGGALQVNMESNLIYFSISEPGQYAVVINDEARVVTQLKSTHCGRPYTTFSNAVSAVSLTGADQYEFVVYNTEDSFADTLITDVRYFKLKYLENQVKYGTTYTVKVRGIWNGIYGQYGNECTVTTMPFPTTQLQPQHWNSTVEMKNKLRCDKVAGVTEYIFNVSSAALGFEQEYVSDETRFKLRYLPGPLNYEETYQVRVRSVMLGDTSEYGPAKTIYTDIRPTNRLRDGYCDTTEIWKSTWLKAETVHYVDEYQFRVINEDHGVNGIYTTNRNRFKLRDVPGTTNCGLTYAVNIRTIMYGDTTEWGDTCFVTTLNNGCRLASPDADQGNEISSLPSNDTKELEGPVIIGAYPNPFNRSVQLNFEIEETQRVYVEVYDAYGRLLFDIPSQSFSPGSHSLTWDGTNSRGNDCPNGTYIMVLRNDRNFVVQSIRLMLKR